MKDKTGDSCNALDITLCYELVTWPLWLTVHTAEAAEWTTVFPAVSWFDFLRAGTPSQEQDFLVFRVGMGSLVGG